VLHTIGLDRVEPVRVRGAEVSPRDVVAACTPDPARLGPLMSGKTCAGTWVRGLGKDGEPLEAYLYQVADNEHCMREWGHQCVVWQTAYNPMIALELLHSGDWSGNGVLGPEAFPARPFLDLLPAYDAPWGVRTRPDAGSPWVDAS
jgi:saccharopine dehydrogenase-like NADP-dependent oxidoreductase